MLHLLCRPMNSILNGMGTGTGMDMGVDMSETTMASIK